MTEVKVIQNLKYGDVLVQEINDNGQPISEIMDRHGESQCACWRKDEDKMLMVYWECVNRKTPSTNGLINFSDIGRDVRYEFEKYMGEL